MSASSKHLGLRAAATTAAAALTLVGGGAFACDISLAEPPGPVLLDYNPFAPVLERALLGMEFRNASLSECALEIVFTDTGGQPFPDFELGGAVVAFQPRTSSGLRRTELTTHNYSLNVPAEGSARAEFDVAVRQAIVIAPGHYTIELRVMVQEAAQPPLIVIPVTLILTSAPRAQINIAGAAGVFGSGSSLETVDFGEAETGATRRAFLQVRANSASTVTFDSEHRGRLAHVDVGADASRLAYRLDVDDEPVDLTSIAHLPIDPPRTLEGISLPMTLTLGPVEGAMSGRYRDTITITVNPD